MNPGNVILLKTPNTETHPRSALASNAESCYQCQLDRALYCEGLGIQPLTCKSSVSTPAPKQLLLSLSNWRMCATDVPM